MESLAAAAIPPLQQASGQDIANTSWAFAALSLENAPLMSAISESAIRKLPSLASQNLANTAWAFSTRLVVDRPLLSAIAASAMRKIKQFGRQRLSNTAWAFATLALFHQPLLDAIASAARRKISEFDPQGIANTAWSFAFLFFHPNEALLEAIAAEAIRRQTEFDTQNCANTVWAYALLVEFHTPLIDAIAAASIPKIHDYSCQSLANTAWAFANLEVMDKPLLAAISAAARRMLHEFTGMGWRRLDLVSFALGLLGIAWAHAFLEVENKQLQSALQAALVQIGFLVDEMDCRGQNLFSQPELEPEAVHGILAKTPHLHLDLSGMIVIHKQPDWEVDGKGRSDKEIGLDEGPPALSTWLRAKLPRSQYPVTRDVELDYGFLHRLDVPSSGLILCGVTFSGLMSLRWQLDNYLIERQYAVWGHDLADTGLNEVSANIDPQTIDSRRSFTSEVRGKPAKSWFRVPAHFHVPRHNSLRAVGGNSESCSAFIVRIRTGRRHQIRAHMLSAGHPTLVDAKYAALQVVFPRLLDYEKGYLNSGCPD